MLFTVHFPAFFHDQCSLHRLVFQVAIDSATPVDDPAAGGSLMMSGAEPFGGYGGPIRSYGRMYGSLDFDDVSRAALCTTSFLK